MGSWDWLLNKLSGHESEINGKKKLSCSCGLVRRMEGQAHGLESKIYDRYILFTGRRIMH